MKERQEILWAVLPGTALVLASLGGVVPMARDIPAYFAPLRRHTAYVLLGQAPVFFNSSQAAGEPFFANPQSALLYPLAWWGLLLPETQAVGVEVGCHLMLLAAGSVFFLRGLGIGGTVAVAGAWAGALSGPVLSAAGVLNNLTTAAWLPWTLAFAQRKRVFPLALTVFASFAAGEPVLALVSGLLAVGCFPSRAALWGGVLGLNLAAVQLLPMAFWVAAGDRGPGSPEAMARGAVSWEELKALFFPGFPPASRPDSYVTQLTLPLWVWLVLPRAVRGGARPLRFLLAAALGLVGVAVVPSWAVGGELFQALTGHLIRYPGRFLFPAAIVLSLAGAWALAQHPGNPWERVWALGSAAVGWVAGAAPGAVLIQAGAALAVASSLAPGVVAAAASWAVGAASASALQLAKTLPRELPCAAVQVGQRLYTPPPGEELLKALARQGPQLEVALALGYSGLSTAREQLRCFSPICSPILLDHLQQADQGPEASWWLDSLGAGRVVSPYPLRGMPLLCQEGGIWVYANPRAFPPYGLWAQLPRPGEYPTPVGEVEWVGRKGDRVTFLAQAPPEGAVFVWLVTPQPGLEFALDGLPVKPLRGVGILQGVWVPGGPHRVEVRYRSPGLGWGCAWSLGALGVLLGGLWGRRF